MGPSPHARAPKHLDIITNTGSHAATGTFAVIIETTEGLKSYPLLFLRETDHDFKELQRAISGHPAPSFVQPLGTLEKVWKLNI